MTNPFFKNCGPLNLWDIYKVLGLDNRSETKKIKIFNITDLNSASSKDITFLHSNKYTSQASITKAAACITTKNLQDCLPNKCECKYLKPLSIQKLFEEDDCNSYVNALTLLVSNLK